MSSKPFDVGDAVIWHVQRGKDQGKRLSGVITSTACGRVPGWNIKRSDGKRVTIRSNMLSHAPAEPSKVQLYEVTAFVKYAVVIAATSEENALAEVDTWERSWHENGDLIDVSDVGVNDTRPLKVAPLSWKDEAHELTSEARQALGLSIREAHT